NGSMLNLNGATRTFNIAFGPPNPDVNIGVEITGNGGLTKAGDGFMTLSQLATYTGTPTVNAGRLIDGAVNAVPATSPLVVNGTGVFDLNGFNQTVASLSGNGTVTNSNATTRTFTINSTGAPAQFDGVLTGNLMLVKMGPGDQTLAGASPNTY